MYQFSFNNILENCVLFHTCHARVSHLQLEIGTSFSFVSSYDWYLIFLYIFLWRLALTYLFSFLLLLKDFILILFYSFSYWYVLIFYVDSIQNMHTWTKSCLSLHTVNISNLWYLLLYIQTDFFNFSIWLQTCWTCHSVPSLLVTVSSNYIFWCKW